MRCPNCAITELPDAVDRCPVCGHTVAINQASAVAGVGIEAGGQGETVVKAFEVQVESGGPRPAAAEDAEILSSPTAEPGTTDLDNDLDTDAAVQRELAGQFRLERLLAAREWSRLYVASDPGREEPVVVKVLPRRLVGDGEEQFHRRAEAAASLRHPHIVPVYRFGATARLFWYAMPHLEGRSLETQHGPAARMKPDSCLLMAQQIARGLAHAHRWGLPHGALKPSNIIVRARGWAMVSDFALPRLKGRRADRSPAADQYALAALTHECLTGEPPGDMPAEALAQLELPAPVRQALSRALAADPGARFPSVGEFAAVLAEARSPRQRPKGPAPSILGLDIESDTPAPFHKVAAIAGVVIVAAIAAVGIERPTVRAASPAPPAGADPVPIRHAAFPAVPSDSLKAPRESVSPAPARATTTARRIPARRPDAERLTLAPTPEAPPLPAIATEPAALRDSQPAPPPRETPAPQPGWLSVNANPWGVLRIDGRVIGNTPQVEVAVGAGSHKLRVERPGFLPFETVVQVARGERVRVVDIQLRRAEP